MISKVVKKIIYQHREERENLLKQAYVARPELAAKTDYLSSPLIKLIAGPRRSGKSVLSLQILENENFA